MRIGASCTYNECFKVGRYRSITPEITPARSTVTALSPRGSPVRKKPQKYEGKVSCEAYRARFALLAARNSLDA